MTAMQASFQVDLGGKTRRLEVKSVDSGERWHATLDGAPFELDVRLTQPGVLSLIVGGRVYRCVLTSSAEQNAVEVRGERFLYSIEDPRSLGARRLRSGAQGGVQSIKAPMPGRIVRLLVAAGEMVAAHQPLIVIEAMKMQNELKSHRAGRVAEIRAQADTSVKAGEVLLVLE